MITDEEGNLCITPLVQRQWWKGELKRALGKLKSDKAGGSSSILPEMAKVAVKRRNFWSFCWPGAHYVR